MQLRALDNALAAMRLGRHRRKSQHAQQRHHKAGVFIGRQAQILLAVNGTLVIKLNLLAAQILRQAGKGFMLGVVGQRGRHGFEQRQALQQHRQFAQCAVEADSARSHFLRFFQQRFAILVHNILQQFIKIALVYRAYHLAHILLGHAARAHGNRLIQKTQSIAHRAHGRAPEQLHGSGLKRHLFAFQHMRQMRRHLLRGHIAQHKLQAAAEHSNRHFVRIGGGENEFHMLGRLFQRFEHGVKRAFREHVHFIDDINFIFTDGGRILGVFQHFADIVDTGV